jgi:histidine ammonia-lyase
MTDAMTLKPGKISMADLAILYWQSPAAKLSPEFRADIDASSKIVINAAKGDTAVYGVNTGFGKLASTRIAPEDTAQLQRNLILSHCCGVGSPLPENIVRLIMVLKLMSLGRGASGVRWKIIEHIQNMLALGVSPVIPGQGSVGASGDLAPLAHFAATMIGEGEATFQGDRMKSADALNKAGLEPIILGSKEGLGMINGTQVSTALALAGFFQTWRCAMTALVSGALSTDAIMASSSPFRREIHELRGHTGQVDVSTTLRALMDKSEIRESHRVDDDRVQDPYCIRCQPQVMGACLDLLRQTGRTLKIEANAVTDNPLVILADNSIVSGGNFHAEPVALAADQIALAIAEIGAISQRRIALMVDPAMNFGLPAFLTPNPGLNSGLMIAEVTSAALMSENKQRAAPCSIDSTPTSANQEDHVSMAAHAARRLLDMNDNLGRIIAIEMMTASQGIEFRAPLKTSSLLQSIIDRLRLDVATLGDDRYLAPDIERSNDLVRSNAFIKTLSKDVLPTMEFKL